MARGAVYGKKSHLYAKLYDSPAKKKLEPGNGDIEEAVNALEALALQEKSPVAAPSRRRALQEKTPNDLVLPGLVDVRLQKPLGSQDRGHGKTRPGKDIRIPAECNRTTTRTHTTKDTNTLKPLPTTIEDAENAPPDVVSAPPIPDVTPLPEPITKTIYQTHTASLLSLSARPLTPFQSWSEQHAAHFAISKIAEASFGEVYRLSLLREQSGITKADESVLKLIALKPPPSTIARRKMGRAAKERLEMMSDPADVASEVRLLERMTGIPGFTNFRDVTILQGQPGSAFVDAWRSWNDSRKDQGKDESEYPDPGKKGSYSANQLWAVIEMQDAGSDLENVKTSSIWMVWDVFWGVVLSLGKGEEGAHFEHRDLHLGNICVSNATEELDESKIDTNKKLGFTSIETTLIDYTISRCDMADLQQPGTEEKDVAYFDLEKDQAVFEGDGAVEYQYDIYRYMRSALYLDDPLADLDERWDEAEASGRTWEQYHPQTNLVWLHFVLHKLIEQIEWPSAIFPDTKDEGVYARWQRGCELEKVLLEVRRMLQLDMLTQSGLWSAGDLMVLAMDEGWLDIEDVIGVKLKPSKKKGLRNKKGRSKIVRR